MRHDLTPMRSFVAEPMRQDSFDDRLQLVNLRCITSSKAAAASLAENYVGLPL